MTTYGGFCEGKLHWTEIDDGFGGSNRRMAPALFRTRKEARAQYEDVRRVEIKPEEPRRRRIR